MKGIFKEISTATEGQYGTAILYAGAIGLILSDIIPTPADALYFHTEKKLRDLWTEQKITPKQYWVRSASAYYLYNPIWWILVLGVMHYKQGDFKDKAKIGLAMIGVGAVLGVIYRNYKKDIEEVRKDAFPIQETKVNFDAKPSPNRIRAVYRQGNKIKFAY
jgi:hypothetical protein